MTEAGTRNAAVRAAVEAWAEQPGPPAAIEVLRHCLAGALLFDGTGSELEMVDGQPGVFAAGSTVRIGTHVGPDGASAALAFTSQAEIERVHESGTEVVSFVQPPGSVLEFTRQNGHEWLLIDPAGPGCALSGAEIDFVLDTPRNDAVRAAMEPGEAHEALLRALRAEGQLLLAVEPDAALPEGTNTIAEPTEVRVRATDAPDGSGTALVVFTSGPEVLARDLHDRIVAQSVEEIIALARESGHAGLLLNPAGPWAYVTLAELDAGS